MHVLKNVFYLAHKYLLSKHQHASIQTMIYVCGAGILIATCALALVISIMNGFEQATYQKMQSIYPDLIIDSDDQGFNQEDIDRFFQNPIPGVAAYSTQYIMQALVACPQNLKTPTMIVLRGINPTTESNVSNITSKIVNPTSAKLSEIMTTDGVMIGSKLAQSLDVEIGDEIFILCHDTKKSHALYLKFNQCPVTVTGIFKTGIDDFDGNLVYCHQQLIEQLFPEQQLSNIHIKLKNLHDENITRNFLSEHLNASVYSWKELYPALLSALKLEKWAMFFILLLIICVASMNIISLIFMYVTQKQRDIVVLLCLGMNQTSIRLIFIILSLMIAFPATCIGLILAWILGILLQIYPCFKLPDNIYDTQYMPVQLELHLFFVILVITMIISLVASWFATHNMKRIKIVELLKTH